MLDGNVQIIIHTLRQSPGPVVPPPYPVGQLDIVCTRLCKGVLKIIIEPGIASCGTSIGIRPAPASGYLRAYLYGPGSTVTIVNYHIHQLVDTDLAAPQYPVVDFVTMINIEDGLNVPAPFSEHIIIDGEAIKICLAVTGTLDRKVRYGSCIINLRVLCSAPSGVIEGLSGIDRIIEVGLIENRHTEVAPELCNRLCLSRICGGSCVNFGGKCLGNRYKGITCNYGMGKQIAVDFYCPDLIYTCITA